MSRADGHMCLGSWITLCLIFGASISVEVKASAREREAEWRPTNPKIIPPAFQGRWASNKKSCRQFDDGVIQISPDEVQGWEWGDEVKSVAKADPPRAVLVELVYYIPTYEDPSSPDYQGDVSYGEPYKEIWALDRQESRLVRAEADENGRIVPGGSRETWIRCGSSRQ